MKEVGKDKNSTITRAQGTQARKKKTVPPLPGGRAAPRSDMVEREGMSPPTCLLIFFTSRLFSSKNHHHRKQNCLCLSSNRRRDCCRKGSAAPQQDKQPNDLADACKRPSRAMADSGRTASSRPSVRPSGRPSVGRSVGRSPFFLPRQAQPVFTRVFTDSSQFPMHSSVRFHRVNRTVPATSRAFSPARFAIGSSPYLLRHPLSLETLLA